MWAQPDSDTTLGPNIFYLYAHEKKRAKKYCIMIVVSSVQLEEPAGLSVATHIHVRLLPENSVKTTSM